MKEIFGKRLAGIPLGIILLAVTATAALAVWIFGAKAILAVTPAQGIDIAYSTDLAVCTLLANPGGGALIASTGVRHCEVTEARPGVVFTIDYGIVNLGSLAICPEAVPDFSSLPVWAVMNSYSAPDLTPLGTATISYEFELASDFPDNGGTIQVLPEVFYDQLNCAP